MMLGIVGYGLYVNFTDEDFKASVKATFNKDTFEIDFEALKEVVAGVGSILASAFAAGDDSYTLNSVLVLADVFAEIVSKAAEKEIDPETLASVKEGIRGLFAAINEVATFLANGEGQTDRIFEFADLVYSSALELKNEIDLITDNPDKSKLEKAEEIYDLVIAKSKEIIGKIYTFLTSTETAEIEA